MEELIKNWSVLNEKANKILQKGKSFKEYDIVRTKMDKIENILRKIYNVDIYEVLKKIT